MLKLPIIAIMGACLGLLGCNDSGATTLANLSSDPIRFNGNDPDNLASIILHNLYDDGLKCAVSQDGRGGMILIDSGSETAKRAYGNPRGPDVKSLYDVSLSGRELMLSRVSREDGFSAENIKISAEQISKDKNNIVHISAKFDSDGLISYLDMPCVLAEDETYHGQTWHTKLNDLQARIL